MRQVCLSVRIRKYARISCNALLVSRYIKYTQMDARTQAQATFTRNVYVHCTVGSQRIEIFRTFLDNVPSVTLHNADATSLF